MDASTNMNEVIHEHNWADLLTSRVRGKVHTRTTTQFRVALSPVSRVPSQVPWTHHSFIQLSVQLAQVLTKDPVAHTLINGKRLLCHDMCT